MSGELYDALFDATCIPNRRVVVGYAASCREKCFRCAKVVDLDTLRIGFLAPLEGPAKHFSLQPRWCHPVCFPSSLSLNQSKSFIRLHVPETGLERQCPGFMDLKSGDKALVRKTFDNCLLTASPTPFYHAWSRQDMDKASSIEPPGRSVQDHSRETSLQRKQKAEIKIPVSQPLQNAPSRICKNKKGIARLARQMKQSWQDHLHEHQQKQENTQLPTVVQVQPPTDEKSDLFKQVASSSSCTQKVFTENAGKQTASSSCTRKVLKESAALHNVPVPIRPIQTRMCMKSAGKCACGRMSKRSAVNRRGENPNVWGHEVQRVRKKESKMKTPSGKISGKGVSRKSKHVKRVHRAWPNKLKKKLQKVTSSRPKKKQKKASRTDGRASALKRKQLTHDVCSKPLKKGIKRKSPDKHARSRKEKSKASQQAQSLRRASSGKSKPKPQARVQKKKQQTKVQPSKSSKTAHKSVAKKSSKSGKCNIQKSLQILAQALPHYLSGAGKKRARNVVLADIRKALAAQKKISDDISKAEKAKKHAKRRVDMARKRLRELW